MKIFLLFQVETVNVCATRCVNNKVCRSFYYNRVTKQCVLVLYTDASRRKYPEEYHWNRYRILREFYK